MVRHLGRLPEEQKQRAAGSYKWEPTFTKSPPIRSKVARRRQSKKAPELHHHVFVPKRRLVQAVKVLQGGNIKSSKKKERKFKTKTSTCQMTTGLLI